VTIQDQVILALTAWRENRGGGTAGMQSVMNVVLNRAAKHGQSPYTVCTTHEQFTSINPPSTMTVAATETGLWPSDTDPQWQTALQMAQRADAGTLPDVTGGATLYYAPAAIPGPMDYTLPSGASISFPQGWNRAAVTYTATVANQVFFTER